MLDPSLYEHALPLPWLQASQHNKAKNPNSVVKKLKEYFTQWTLDGILVKELDCQNDNGVVIYNPIKKSRRKQEYYVPFDVGSITSQLPTICNTYAPLDFYHQMAHFQNKLTVRDNYCVELFALMQKNDVRKKLRLAVVHLRRQNSVVCDLLLICAVSVPLPLNGRVFAPYRTIVEAAIAFAKGQKMEDGDGVYYRYNTCRDSAENLFRCKLLTKEATTVLSGSIAHHMGFRFYPGQSHFATFAATDLTPEERTSFIRALKLYFDPSKIEDGTTEDRPTTAIEGGVPVIGPHLWSILTELNAFPHMKSRHEGETQEFTNKERLQAVTSYLRPGFVKWSLKGKRGKKPKQLKPTGYTHETNYESILAAAKAFNQGSTIKHNALADVEVFVCMQSYMFMMLMLCPGSDVSTARQFYTRVGASSFVKAAPEQDGAEFDTWLKKAKTAMSDALNTLAQSIRLLSSSQDAKEERKLAAINALMVCQKIRGGQLQSFPLLRYLNGDH